MMADLVIGIDVGTTTVKSAIFELPGLDKPLIIARRPAVGFSTQPGWSEIAPDAVEAAVFATVRSIATQVGPDRIAAVGISGTACGAWLADSAFRPVRPAILWNDGRAAPITTDWQARGLMDRIFDISGNVPFPGYTLSVLAWLDRYEPESLSATHRVLCCKDWLRGKLTGIMASDQSDASYVPFDIMAGTWSIELAELCGVSRWQSLLPELLDPASMMPLTAEGAAATGLLQGTPVAVGATDIVAGVVGAGAWAAGGTVTILGTSANSTVVSSQPLFEPRNVGIMARGPLGRYARSFINTSGSATLDWGARLLCKGDVTALLHLADSATAGADGLLFVPYLSPAGTVSPRVDPHATGTFSGLRVHHGPAHVARAIVEGLALAVADCYAYMPVPVTEIICVGGGAQSDLLLQTIADLSGVPVTRPAGDEFGARGVAILAAWAIGAIGDLDAAIAPVERETEFVPSRPSPLEGQLKRYQRLAKERALASSNS